MPDPAVVEGVTVDTRHWIGGRRVASAGTFTDISPIDERPLAEVAAGGAPEVAQAVAAAQRAFPGWAALPRDERADILHRVADGIDKRAEELAVVETRDPYVAAEARARVDAIHHHMLTVAKGQP